ncbi:hypothetical protein DFAR_1240012 [Desulfarculales bacterium]
MVVNPAGVFQAPEQAATAKCSPDTLV